MGANPDQTLAMFTVIPAEVRTTRARRSWSKRPGPRQPPDHADANDIRVTGPTAVNIDITDRLAAAVPEYLTIIVGLSLLLLLLVFRSIAIPLTATAGFLLSIAATFGVRPRCSSGGGSSGWSASIPVVRCSASCRSW